MKKIVFVLSLVVLSLKAQAVQVGLGPISTSENIYACNLSLNAKPIENTNGKVIGTITYDNILDPNRDTKSKSGGWVLDDKTTAIFSSTAQWSARLTSLRLAFSTEQMGVGYNVHICYAGPIEQKTGPKDDSEKIYTVLTSMNHSLNEYAKASQLYYKVITKCDLRGRGQQVSARKSSELVPRGSMEVDFSYATNWAPFDGAYRENSTILNNYFPKHVPRYCEIVFQFKEASTALRPANLLYTDVNLGVDIY